MKKIIEYELFAPFCYGCLIGLIVIVFIAICVELGKSDKIDWKPNSQVSREIDAACHGKPTNIDLASSGSDSRYYVDCKDGTEHLVFLAKGE